MQPNFWLISIPRDPNSVLRYEKVKNYDVAFLDKSDLDEHLSRSAILSNFKTELPSNDNYCR